MAKTFLGADGNTNHTLLPSTTRLKLLRPKKKRQLKPSFDYQKLNNEEVCKCSKRNWKPLKQTVDHNIDNCTNITRILNNTASETLKAEHGKKNNERMTEKILDLMEERRKHMNMNEAYHKQFTELYVRK